MSRVGSKPIVIPSGVSVKISGRTVVCSNNKEKSSIIIPEALDVKIEGDKIIISLIAAPNSEARSIWGTIRANLNNAVMGLDKEFEKVLELVGVGFKGAIKDGKLHLKVHYSHEVVFEYDSRVKIVCDKSFIQIRCHDKQLLGDTVASIKAISPPDSYKGKGIKEKGQVLVLKSTKGRAGKK